MLTLGTTDLNSGLTATNLAQALVGPGITVSNAKYTGDRSAGGTYTGGISEGLGTESGVMLSSGKISNAAGPNNDDGITAAFGRAGDAQLNALIPGFETHDASVLEFDFVATGDTLSFQYVFSSDEYNEFVDSSFNDVFAFFLNGTNVALIPGTNTPVSINNVNLEKNSEFYRDNDMDDFSGATPFHTQADGFTVVLQSAAAIKPGTNHIKLAIADAGDFALDSWVFLTANSFVSGKSEIEITKVDTPDPVAAGDPLTYTLVVTNHGPDPATATILQDTLPLGITFVGATSTKGAVTQTGGVATAAIGSLAVGETATVTITVVDPTAGTITNTATVQAAQVDLVPDNNSATATTTVTRFKVTSATINEGDSGLKDVVVSISQLTGHSDTKLMTYATVDGSATSGNDYVPLDGTLTFAPGETQKFITVQVVGDKKVEADEAFAVRVEDANSPPSDRAEGTITIVNDDTTLVINDVTIIEGEEGTKNALFTVTAIGAIQPKVTVHYNTQDGTANAGSDYLPVGGELTFLSSALSRTITVPIVGDKFNEADEYFFLHLSNAVGSEIDRTPAIGTIIDNDRVPVLYVNDVQVTSTQAGLAAVFTVALDIRSGRTVTVQYATADFTATSPDDYTSRSGTLTFNPGTNTLQVTVPVVTDPAYAPNEQFSLDLANPLNAYVGDGHGVATIVFAAVPPTQYILDDGDAGYQQTVGWTNITNLAAYALDYDYHAAGNGTGIATWGLTNLPAGSYEVFTRWVPFSNRATNAPYTILDGANARGTVLVNQQLAPVGDRLDNISWQSLGTFLVTTGTLRVRLSDNANGYVVADAIRIVPHGIPDPVPEIDVSGASHSIGVGDTTPSADDGTDFGSTSAANTPITREFTIANNGNADLQLAGVPRVRITGPGAAQFSVVAQPDFTIMGGRTSKFQIKFQPLVAGAAQATVLIDSNDVDEPVYSFEIAGNATAAVPFVQNVAMPLDVNGDALVSARDAVIVINALARQLNVPAAAPLASAAAGGNDTSSTLYYTDVDGNGIVAPHDALMVINYLIRHPVAASPAVAAPQVQAFAATDQAIDELTAASAPPPVVASTATADSPAKSAAPLLTSEAVSAAFETGNSDDDADTLTELAA